MLVFGITMRTENGMGTFHLSAFHAVNDLGLKILRQK